jgi:putative flavoprotein involved in K+ transport
VEHQVLTRWDALGGAWQDRWDSFYLNTPNFSFMLQGLTYDGPEPDAFLPRDAVIDLFRDYAPRIAAPVQLGTEPQSRAARVKPPWCVAEGTHDCVLHRKPQVATRQACEEKHRA